MRRTYSAISSRTIHAARRATAACYRPAVAANVYGLRLLGDPVVRRLGAAIIAVLGVAFRLIQVPATPPDHLGYDFSAYWAAADHLLHGQPIYSAAQIAGPYAPQSKDLYLYSPPVAALVTPFALFSPTDPLVA